MLFLSQLLLATSAQGTSSSTGNVLSPIHLVSTVISVNPMTRNSIVPIGYFYVPGMGREDKGYWDEGVGHCGERLLSF